MTNHLTIKGRLGRSKYQNQYLLSLGIVALAMMVYELRMVLGIENAALVIALGGLTVAFTFLLFSAVRRLHDLDRPAWHLILALVPVYNLYLILSLLCLKGEAEENPYGFRPEPL